MAPPAPSPSSPPNWRRRIALLLGLLLLALALSIGILVAANSRIAIAPTAAGDGALTVETDFPNATCQKTLSLRFPFVHIVCDEKPGAGE